MTSTFRASLVNPPGGDPALYVEIFRDRRAFLFDIGEIRALPNRKILKVSSIFVTHAHMDHFIGFDHFLRVHMGKGKEVTLFGPKGITARVKNKLKGYTWNLIEGQALKFTIVEILKRKRRFTEFRCSEKFEARTMGEVEGGPGPLLNDPIFTVRCDILDHGIPSLGFSLKERVHLNVRKDVMVSRGFQPGEWLTLLKERIRGNDLEGSITVPIRRGGYAEMKVEELYSSLIIEKEGEKIAYISDAGFSGGNIERIIRLAKDSTTLYCESHFLSEDEEKAAETWHLTAAQAGEIARLARAGRLVIFHFSQKYEDDFSPLYREAHSRFPGTELPDEENGS